MAADLENLTDEDKAKILAAKKFVENRDAYFPTVHSSTSQYFQ